jgi:hypothetical protein
MYLFAIFDTCREVEQEVTQFALRPPSGYFWQKNGDPRCCCGTRLETAANAPGSSCAAVTGIGQLGFVGELFS